MRTCVHSVSGMRRDLCELINKFRPRIGYIYCDSILFVICDRLCGLVVRVLGYRSASPGSIPGITRKEKVVGLERGPLSLVSTTEELLDSKIAAPV
jgi:hypothetical protein